VAELRDSVANKQIKKTSAVKYKSAPKTIVSEQTKKQTTLSLECDCEAGDTNGERGDSTLG